MTTAFVSTSDPNKDKAVELRDAVGELLESLDVTVLGDFVGAGVWADNDEWSHGFLVQFEDSDVTNTGLLLRGGLRLLARRFDQEAIGFTAVADDATLLYSDSALTASPQPYRCEALAPNELQSLRRIIGGDDEPTDMDLAIAKGWTNAQRVAGTEHQYFPTITPDEIRAMTALAERKR